MIIKEGSVREIHNWFLTEETEEIVLCIFLCANQNNVMTLARTIESAFQMDAIIGRKIGFLITARGLKEPSSINIGGGEYHIIGADYISKSGEKYIARDFIDKFDMERLRQGGQPADQQHYREASKALARSSASLVPEFMEFYGVHHGELPCLITLVKGVEEVGITRCPQDLSSDHLFAWMRKVADVVDKVETDFLHKDFGYLDIGKRIALTTELEREKSAKLEKISKAATGICKKYNVDQAQASTLVSSLLSNDLIGEEKRDLIRQFNLSHPGASADNRWPKIFALQERIDEINIEIIGALDRESLLTLDQKLREEQARLNSIFSDIRSLTFDERIARTISIPGVPRQPSSQWETIERVNTAVDIGQKINSAIAYVARLITIGA